MRSFIGIGMVCVFCVLLIGISIAEEALPVIPVGLDAYRMWEDWPRLRIGARAYMRSTYDRRGGNESADASHFLYQLADDFNVTLDVEGRGVLYFARYNHWHGSPWHYEVDGKDFIVQESSSSDPDHPVEGSVFLPQKLFPNPLTWTWSVTKGADLMWVPVPFEERFRMGYSRTHYGTGYYIYHHYMDGANLSQPIKAWDGKTPPDEDVLKLLNQAGTDLIPRADTSAGKKINIKEKEGVISIPQNGVVTLSDIEDGPSVIRAFELFIPNKRAVDFSNVRLTMTWDRREEPSVDAPVSLFFGAGVLYNRDQREYLVKGFPCFIRYEKDDVHLACYYPMPFFHSARIELNGLDYTSFSDIRWRIRYEPLQDPSNHVGYFHATYRDHPNPERGKDLVLLDTKGVEGQMDWCGHFVGTSWIFSHDAVLNTLEGDPRFFFDDSQTPQAYGTGTEEWGGGGDYWGGRNMTLPFAGHPVGARNKKEAKSEEDLIQSAYRFLLADLMPFGKNAVIRLEHGGINQSQEHYETVTYWYGLPGSYLTLTDTLNIGDRESESIHNYTSPDASDPYEITSRYEWGPDTIHSSEHVKAEPANYIDMEFEAKAGSYTIWVRGKGLRKNNLTDAVWIQFDDEIGTHRLGKSYNHNKGFGNWLDTNEPNRFAWSSALPQDKPQTVTFHKSGIHRLRIQPRHGPHILDQIWLSQTQKTLPKVNQSKKYEKNSPNEIILSAGNAKTIEGTIQIVTDKKAFNNKAFRIENGQIEIFPPLTKVGRKTNSYSEFTLKLDPQNCGVMLRRTLDYSFPNQRAEVYVTNSLPDNPEWKSAGIWYLAGSNTCVYSNPREETGVTQHKVQTSNRRFRDDEFLIPRKLTEGRGNIRVRIKFTPVERPLFLGHPIPELAWSEIKYKAYCFVVPEKPF